jgi:transposase
LLYFEDMNEAVVSQEKYDNLLLKYNLLFEEFNKLKKMVYGSKKDRWKPVEVPSEQLSLGFEGMQEEVAVAPKTEQITYTRKKNANHKGRQALPTDLPVEEVIIEPEGDLTGMKHIGDEITETVDYYPGVLVKRRYIRRKYVRIESEESETQLVIGELPKRVIPKGIAEAGLLAYIIVSKYVDHLPFYRLIEKFKREHDWNIQKSTLNDWFAACCKLLEPLYEELKKQVLQTDYLQADESPNRVLDSNKPKATHQGYMWVYRNGENGLVLFDYRKGRGMDGPSELLKDFSGYLQCDGYAAYTALSKRMPQIQLVSCLAHIRRKFVDATGNHPEKAGVALGMIQQLYELEKTYKSEGLTPNQRKERRMMEAKPVYDRLMNWVEENHKQNLSKESIGKALHYAYCELPQLESYLKDGRIEIDNNLIENKIRPLALGRKNYLFSGSHEGAERSAMIYSIIGSCKSLGINPFDYLKVVLEVIGEYPVNRIQDLLPSNFQQFKMD